MQRMAPARRWGYTLVELALVVTIVALVTIPGVRALSHHLDALAVRAAVADAAGVVARARDEALGRHEIVSLRIDTARGTLLVRAGSESLARHALGHAYAVTLAATRDSIAFDARGLGHGPANLTLVARRGRAADTLVLSRLGRTRY